MKLTIMALTRKGFQAIVMKARKFQWARSDVAAVERSRHDFDGYNGHTLLSPASHYITLIVMELRKPDL